MNTEREKMVDEIVKQARLNLEHDGEIAPVFFVHTPQGLAVILTPFENDFQKQMVVLQVKAFAHEHKADWLLFVTEGWAVKAKAEDKETIGRPSLHPERVEAVIFNLETKGENNAFALAEQTLYTDGHKSFGEVKFEEMPHDAGKGTFQNLL